MNQHMEVFTDDLSSRIGDITEYIYIYYIYTYNNKYLYDFIWLRPTMSDIWWVKLWHPKICHWSMMAVAGLVLWHSKTSHVWWTVWMRICTSAAFLHFWPVPCESHLGQLRKHSSLRSCKFSSSTVSDMAQGQPWRWHCSVFKESKEHHPKLSVRIMLFWWTVLVS